MATFTSRLTLKNPFFQNFTCRLLQSQTHEIAYYRNKNVNRIFSKNFQRHQSSSSDQQTTKSGDVNPRKIQTSKAQFKFSCFDDIIAYRHQEALRTVVIQVRDVQSAGSVWNSCVQFGNIRAMFFYSLSPQKNFILVEFESELSVQNLLQNSIYPNFTDIIPAQSQFVWIKAQGGQQTNVHSLNLFDLNVQQDKIIDEENLKDLLASAKTVEDQIHILHEHTKLTEIGQRLRWLVGSQVERSLAGLFPNARVFPFGSSVNGCGRDGSDLDVVFSLFSSKGSSKESTNSPFVFQTKAALSNGRLQVQRHMETIADILQNFVPGCSQVKRILQARVPIIKYHHEFTGIDCDLSMSNMTGVYMSELLFLFGEIDPRFRPLVTAVRHWGRSAKLTNSVPGRTITNFTLTLLVVYFLQQRKILPTMNELIRNARPQDKRVTEGIDCTFLRDWTSLQGISANEESVAELFHGFLQFVEGFDFRQRGISIIWGDTIIKPESNPLYVQNPLERELNVSKNVSLEEVARLVAESRNALYNLETDQSASWGLLSFSSGSGDLVKHHVVASKKLMSITGFEVKGLFDGEDELASSSQTAKSSARTESDSTVIADNKSSTSGKRRNGKPLRKKDVVWKYW